MGLLRLTECDFPLSPDDDGLARLDAVRELARNEIARVNLDSSELGWVEEVLYPAAPPPQAVDEVRDAALKEIHAMRSACDDRAPTLGSPPQHRSFDQQVSHA